MTLPYLYAFLSRFSRHGMAAGLGEISDVDDLSRRLGVLFDVTVFINYNQQGGPRGEGKAESTNYLMTMQQHRWGQAHFCSGRCFRRSR